MEIRASACAEIETGDRVVHGQKGKLFLETSVAEDWMGNLESVPVARMVEEVDQLEELRRRGERVAPAGTGLREPPEKEKKRSRSSSSSGKKKKDKKRKKKKKKVSEEGKEDLSGRHPVSASAKGAKVLFAGTGMDEKEKVRSRVMKKARKIMKAKKSAESSTGSSNSSSEDSQLSKGSMEGGLFTESNLAKKVAEKAPGVLCYESLKSMRQNLLVEQGEDITPSSSRPIALLYFRQELQKKVSGPMSREMLNLSAALDNLVRGKPAQAADIISQRLKSCEASAQGVHWTIAQRMEVAAHETHAIAQRPELQSAQRENYQDSRIQYLASLGPNRKGNEKGKGKGKEDRLKGQKGDKGDGDRGRWKGKEGKEKEGKAS